MLGIKKATFSQELAYSPFPGQNTFFLD